MDKQSQNELYKIYRNDPVFFCEHALGIYTWSKMREIMESVKNNKRTAVRASHGVSKTFTAACIAVWFFNVFPESKVITTAPTWTQVENLLWSEINRLYRESRISLDGRCLTVEIKTELSEHYAIGFSTDKASKAEGYHAPYILFIFDEAKGIAQWMWDAVRGAMTGGHVRLLAISTTDGVQIGEQYYRCFMNDDKNQWNKIHIDCLDTPFFTGERFQGITQDYKRVNIDADKMLDKIQIATPEYEKECADEWGIDSVLYKTKARGDIIIDIVDTIISLSSINQMFNNFKENGIIQESGFDEVGVDVARKGDDDSVFYMRRNYQVKKRQVWHTQDTQVLCDQLEAFVEHKYETKIKIDDTGVGGSVTDGMRRRGYKNVIGICFNQLAKRHDVYIDAISEMWFETAKILHLISCEYSKRLETELANRKREEINKKGQLSVESKKKYKDRGFRSPDEADAFLLSFYEINTEENIYFNW